MTGPSCSTCAFRHRHHDADPCVDCGVDQEYPLYQVDASLLQWMEGQIMASKRTLTPQQIQQLLLMAPSGPVANMHKICMEDGFDLPTGRVSPPRGGRVTLTLRWLKPGAKPDTIELEFAGLPAVPPLVKA